MALLIHGIDVPKRRLSSISFVLPGGGTTLVEFLEYHRPSLGDPHSQNGETPAGQRIRRLREAIDHIVHRISTYPPANGAFHRLPGGRTLAEMIAGPPDILISYSPSNFTVYAASSSDGLSLTGRCFHGTHASGRRVESTIIHELAHLNGASDDPASLEAENVLLHCRMGDTFDRRNTG